ncbi:MAG TPA: phosphodiesterase [Roseiflexaceae bacterium]|nr:phosphodiesterase [Roseiflexaceae bacterium]
MIIAQISDPHITQIGGDSDRKYATTNRLQRVVAHLMHLSAPPDVVIITGDCVDNGGVDEYQRFRDLLRPLTMPVFVIPGNHDDRSLLREMFGPQGGAALPGFVQYVVDDWPVRLIALDSHIPGQGAGRLCGERLGWLEQRLAEAPDRPTMIFLHHPPFRTGLPLLDQLGLDGADALGAIVARYPNVERILAGHVHATMQRRFHGTLAMTCPSTAFQLVFDFNRPEQFSVVMEPPACLLHVWRARMGLITQTSLVGEYSQPADGK